MFEKQNVIIYSNGLINVICAKILLIFEILEKTLVNFVCSCTFDSDYWFDLSERIYRLK